jgi:thioredoxin-related protein
MRANEMLRYSLLILYLVGTSNWSSPVCAAGEVKPAPGKVTGAATAAVELPHWFKDSFLEIYADVREATERGRHLILFFYLSDCPYCHKMLEESFEGAPYRDFIQSNFDVIGINIRGAREVAFNSELSLQENELAKHLGVRYTPTILFLDSRNRTVLRLNGYRSRQAFKYALDFVHEQAYASTSLARYIEAKAKAPVYRLRDDPLFSGISDLHQVADKPLAVIFEDRTCDQCDLFHDEILANAETAKLLGRFTVVRFDALSEEPIVDIAGRVTTPKALADELDITYRPGLVLFDRGKEIIRVDGMLRSFHFQQVLRYVAEKGYERYPEFGDYRRANRREILESGRDIDIWK